ncbi:MAG: sensor histidine kinase [Bacteroidota bacterium]
MIRHKHQGGGARVLAMDDESKHFADQRLPSVRWHFHHGKTDLHPEKGIPRTAMAFIWGMEKIASSIITYCSRHFAWVFLMPMLLLSYALTQAAGSEAAIVFFRFLGSLSMISAPVLVYAFRREAFSLLVQRMARIAVFGVFTGSMLVYGPEMQQLPFTNYLLTVDSLANQQSIRLLFVLFLLSEGLLWWSDRRKDQPNSSEWLKRIPLHWVAAGLVLILSIGIVVSSNSFQEAQAQWSGTETVLHFFLLLGQIFLVYYAYYGLYYLHHHLLFRKLLQERGIIFYLLGVAALLLVFTPLHAALAYTLPAIHDYRLHSVGISRTIFSDVHLGLSASVLLFSLPVIVVREWYRKEQAIVSLQAEKTTTELNLLKEQINPHFFFNTLNNLYAMSLTNEAKTPDTILQLSELMRYVIYRGKEETVTLGEEKKYLQDYLELQSLRLKKQLDLRFRVEIDDEGRRIAPLLLIILLENAFKHGIEPAEEDCFLYLTLRADDQGIHFSCHNSVEVPTPPNHSPGLGLANLRRRLDLLYPSQHTLELQQTAQDFTAALHIQ